MKINTNTWNKIRYTLYTPGYDFIGRFFNASRKKSIEALEIQKNDRVLFVGAGTGLDLEFIRKDCEIVATDITPSMVERIKKRSKNLNIEIQTLLMDGHSLQFPDDSFDVVILHLILAVIPDPVRCILEAERVLKPGGQMAVFDKFLGKEKRVSVLRKILNPFANMLFSDINRSFEHILKNTGLRIISDENADFKGAFRLIRLKKID